MEIYKDLTNPASKEFEKLLNSKLSKTQIEEGKIIDGKINKITEKFVFLFIEGLKSEPVLDINELKTMGLTKDLSVDVHVQTELDFSVYEPAIKEQCGITSLHMDKAAAVISFDTCDTFTVKGQTFTVSCRKV